MNLRELYGQATGFQQKGNLAEAEKLYLQILSLDPGGFGPRYMLGVVRTQQGRYAEALELIGDALKAQPDAVVALVTYGNVLSTLGRFEEAMASYDRALAIKPDLADALCNRGYALHALKRFKEAVRDYNAALRIAPDKFDDLYNLGVVLARLKRFAEALESFDRALAAWPDLAMAWSERGNALRALNRLEEALESYDKALTLKPDYVAALTNRGNVLRDMKRYDEALMSYRRALAIQPDHGETLYSHGVALRDLKRFEEALASYESALAADRAGASTDSDRSHIMGGIADAALHLCDWQRMEKIAAWIGAQDKATFIFPPFTLLGYSDDASLQFHCAANHINERVPVHPSPLWNGTAYRHERIRVAYVSSDFRQHPMTSVITELLQLHDRSRFEILGISIGSDDRSPNRARIVKAVDRFVDAQFLPHRSVAEMLRQMEVDIAVDLNGHTTDARPEIFSHRPAPVQVNYLGFPGTMGGRFMDYVIADRVVLPFDRQPYFSEQIVHMPDSYWVHDSRQAADHMPTRRDAGLPERGFVFCCFNNNWKVTAPVFDVWMRLLNQVEGSVLWLLVDNLAACENLRRQAAARGVDPQRLVFAARIDPARHLGRHRLADLFLDTLPYNAHSTACDALWMGLPLVTCRGKSFAGRVAASLLHAVGLPELVTESLEGYEAAAIKLARDPSMLRALTSKLETGRTTCPLFDTQRFRRGMEAAYVRMWESAERGKVPESFSVQ